jgi:serine/threonine protein kinase
MIGSPSDEEANFIDEELAASYIKSLPKYERKPPGERFAYCRPEWEDFLNKTLLFDPRKRLTIDEALRHPIFDQLRNEKDYDFHDNENFELFLPSDMTMEEIREKLVQ